MRDARHLRDVDEPRHGLLRDVAPRRFGDVDGQVADPFEVGVDLHGGDNRAQVRGHRLVQREQLEAAVVDLDVELIDRLIPREDAVHARGVALDERPHRRADAILGEAAHLEQPRLELFQFFLKMTPVTFPRIRHGRPTRTFP